MAGKKRGRKRKSVMGYFKQLFAKHPEWLKETTNDVIIAQYRADHKMPPDAKVSGKVKQSLSNTKSLLRTSRKGAKERVQASVAGMTSGSKMEDCLILAKNLDAKGLSRVIDHLRAARNLVVWKMGQPKM
jgi:hypothetical protein